MKSYTVIFFLIALVSLPFTACQFIASSGISFSLQTNCSTDQINTATKAIDGCELENIPNSLKCISKAITDTSSERWNIFVKNKIENPDVVSFWIYDNCYIYIENYGKLNRTYTLWPTQSYLRMEGQKNQIYRFEEKKDPIQTIKRHIKTNSRFESIQTDSLANIKDFACAEWKKSQVKNIAASCDIENNNRAAECIISRIKDQLTENWNVKVSTTLQADVNYYFYDGCSLQYEIGRYPRYVYIWKAAFTP